MWTDKFRPYEWVQGLEWEVNGKWELVESLGVITDGDFQSWKLAKPILGMKSYT